MQIIAQSAEYLAYSVLHHCW